MRNIKLEDKELKKLLFERGNIVGKARKITKEIEKLQQEQQKMGYKMDRLKDKIKPIIDSRNIELDEFEVISRIYLEKEEPMVEIVNQIEEYKILIRGKNNK